MITDTKYLTNPVCFQNKKTPQQARDRKEIPQANKRHL